MAKMNKMTKKQYTRKHLFMGAVIFVAVVLLVTGIAIWLLLGSLSSSVDGTLSVASVVASPMSFTDFRVNDEQVDKENETQVFKNIFVFDSAQDDYSGRVFCDGINYARMAVKISGKLNYADVLERMSYVLELPEGVVQAAKEGYLDISSCYDENFEPKTVDVIVSDGGKLRDSEGRELIIGRGRDGINYLDFEFTIKLEWGEKFNGKNPSRFYDEPEDLGGGASVPDEQVMETLEYFANLINGENNEKDKSFFLTITATPNK